jgi:hypothetical protein
MRRRSIAALCAVALLAAACGTATPSGGEPEPTTTVPSNTDTTAACSPATDTCTPDETPSGPGGEVTVTVDDATYEFRATRCLAAVDVFVVDGVSADGSTTVAIRHASPPTRPDPQPSMSYILIQPEPEYESPPAAVVFDTYDPEAGIATGSAEPGVTFTVRCDR